MRQDSEELSRFASWHDSTMLTALVTFAFAAGLIVLLPGPDTLVVVRNLIRGGRRSAALTVIGVLSGLAVWVTAAALGLAALLRASRDGYTTLRVVGAIYLIWLGVNSLRTRAAARGAATSKGNELQLPEPPRRLVGTGYRAGLATDLLNPKVGVFFVSFLPGFVPAGHAVGSTSLIFGAIFVVETAMYFALLLALAARVTKWMSEPRVRRRLDRVTGLVLIGFGLRIASER
jgi:threonine/homoserine/homoserine lactone efflux protein